MTPHPMTQTALDQPTPFASIRRSAIGLGVSALMFALASCGGSGGSGGAPGNALVLKGVIEDGKIAGATVFLDLNDNKVRDADEPESGVSDADGNFSLTIPPDLRLPETALARTMLVANVPASARDRDDNGLTLAEAGKSAFTFLAPAAAALTATAQGAVQLARSEMPVNPVTSLVAHELINGGHPSLKAATDAVSQAHPALQGKDPFARFTDGRDPEVAAYAKALTVALGDIRQHIVERARQEASDVATREGTDPVAAAKRAEAAVTSGAAARDTALAALAQVVRERDEITSAIRQVLPDPAAARAVPPEQLARTIRSKLDEIRAQKDSVISTAGMPSAQQPAAMAALNAAASAAERIRYIVVFKNDLGAPAARQARDQIMGGTSGTAGGARVEFSYETALRGFAVSLPAAAADAFLEAMANNPNVDRVEADSIVSRQIATQTAPPWGLDRADQRSLPLSTSFSWNASGVGVRAFVVDTGILASHVQFSGRVAQGYTAIADGRLTEDCNGHGTHVAGTIGGSVVGIAKSVTLVPVRVLDCTGSGTLSGVIAGVDWVAANAPARSVMNLSLGGGASSTLDQAVSGAVARGVTAVVAAGNNTANACNYSPARVSEAITVGATTSSDQRASFSNFGACLDLFAPGESIVSTWYTSTSATASLSGTSMASPHVAGAAAQLLEIASDPSPAAIALALIAAATPNTVLSAGTDSPNRLLYADSNAGSTTPSAPVTTVKVYVSGLSASALKLRNGWAARVTVKAMRADGTAASGALVKGDFTAGGKAISCTTDATGTCTLSSGTISSKVVSTVWTATSISGTGYAYDSAANTVSSITISRPQ